MTTQRRALRYFLLFVLLFGQWLYLAHSQDHAAHDSGHPCQLCVHSVKFDAFLPAILLESPVLTPRPFLFVPFLTIRSTSHSRFHDSRAPPRS